MTTRIALLARLVSPVPILALVLLLASPARADAIDGHWCAEDGRHLSIDGPAIVTPSGKSLRGDYRRHFFSYVIPTPEAHAGAAMAMTLVSDDVVHLKAQIDAAKMEIWRRCDFTM
jgi:hypothetical protein